ncbi:hypothetical protein QOT17_021408 [Balamuthia mandrillaris]
MGVFFSPLSLHRTIIKAKHQREDYHQKVSLNPRMSDPVLMEQMAMDWDWEGAREEKPFQPKGPSHVVCVNGSRESDAALAWAFDNFPAHHSFILMYGMERPSLLPQNMTLRSLASDSSNPSYSVQDKRKELEAECRQKCEQNNRECGFMYFLSGGARSFGETVCKYAHEKGARSVVMGRRENTSLAERFVLGSASQSVMTKCPDYTVTIVREPDKEREKQG